MCLLGRTPSLTTKYEESLKDTRNRKKKLKNCGRMLLARIKTTQVHHQTERQAAASQTFHADGGNPGPEKAWVWASGDSRGTGPGTQINPARSASSPRGPSISMQGSASRSRECGCWGKRGGVLSPINGSWKGTRLTQLQISTSGILLSRNSDSHSFYEHIVQTAVRHPGTLS